MAHHASSTVIQQLIPREDMTELELLLLAYVFYAEEHEAGFYFYTDDGPASFITVSRDRLAAALAASQHTSSEMNAYVAERLPGLEPYGDGWVDLDLSGTDWTFILQDIVARSKSLNYLTAVTSFTSSKLRPDALGGLAVLVTAEEVTGKSTNEILEDLLENAGLTQAPERRAVAA